MFCEKYETKVGDHSNTQTYMEVQKNKESLIFDHLIFSYVLSIQDELWPLISQGLACLVVSTLSHQHLKWKYKFTLIKLFTGFKPCLQPLVSFGHLHTVSLWT